MYSRILVIICALLVLQDKTRAATVSVAMTRVPETTEMSSIEDPSEAAATTSVGEFANADQSSSSNSEHNEDDICLSCYDKVKIAQEMINLQTSLSEKERNLLRRRNKQLEAARTNRPTRRRFDQNNVHNSSATNAIISAATTTRSTVQSRTLPTETEPIVISRLRVARAAVAQPNQSNQNKFNQLNKKDLDLKRLKQEQQHQLNATCESLLALQDCLSRLSRECIGNLLFHSLEVYANQWHGKLNCPYRNNPGIRVFPNLVRSTFIPDQEPKIPVPRPITSDEAIRDRITKILPDGFGRPTGVILKPTLSESASERFRQILAQQQQQQEGNNKQLRDFSGHFQQQRIIQRNHEQINDGSNFQNFGKILLVPCCFAIMVAIVALASLYYWRPPIDLSEVKA